MNTIANLTFEEIQTEFNLSPENIPGITGVSRVINNALQAEKGLDSTATMMSMGLLPWFCCTGL